MSVCLIYFGEISVPVCSFYCLIQTLDTFAWTGSFQTDLPPFSSLSPSGLRPEPELLKTQTRRTPPKHPLVMPPSHLKKLRDSALPT